MAVSAGARLRALRLRLGFTTREVASLSHRIALEEGRDVFELSHARLVQIEGGQSTPSIYKLFTLSAVYGTPIKDLLAYYVDLESPRRHHLKFGCEYTHPIASDLREADDEGAGLPSSGGAASPSSADATLPDTTLLSQMVQLWDHLPASLLNRLDVRHNRYAVIGTSDYTMYPLLRPGSFVQIEKAARPNATRPYKNEYERPIYFIEHRSGYLCSWCEIYRERLISIPHPLSPCRTRKFNYPMDARILGMVTAIAVRLTRMDADQAASPAEHLLASPAQAPTVGFPTGSNAP